MDDFFSSVAGEFKARSAQIRELVKTHGPSIGAGHEVLLRSFLRDYLPRWVSVGHGFVKDHEGTISGQTDILLYNSMYYAPLYRIDDFVIIPPESVVGCIEVKTNVKEEDFIKAMDRMSLIKRIAGRAEVGM